jgi:putative transposase
MSTTQQSDPYENAIAERINGILIWLEEKIASVDIARKIIKQAVDIYNNK